MACFLVPGTEAIVTTIVTAVVKKKENNDLKKASVEGTSAAEKIGTKFSTKLGWLNKMLWGGSALLAFEHVWHGEVIPVFPFLTAVKEGDNSVIVFDRVDRAMYEAKNSGRNCIITK